MEVTPVRHHGRMDSHDEQHHVERVEREVRQAFEIYEAALLANDIETMDRWFADDQRLVRFGIAEIQRSAAEVREWRRQAVPVPKDRRHERVTIAAIDGNTAIAALEFRNGDSLTVGRQSQVWHRETEGWRIAHAHVSMMSPTELS
jgi:ketosteroid isomerase-like protein